MNDQMTYKDRKGWLIVFGIYEVLAGLSLALIAFFSFLISNKLPIPKLWITTTGIMMTVLAIQRVILGIGSIQAKRWARALVLIFSWVSLVTGSLSIIFSFFITQPAPPYSPSLNPQIMGMIRLISKGFEVFISVVVPLVFVLFYGSEDVKKTCESRNPNPSWTDRCPLIVLGLSIYKCIGALAFMGFIPFGFGYPFFFTVIEGIPGSIIWIAHSILMIYAAVLLYGLHLKGWFLAFGIHLFGFINMGCYLISKGFADYFSRIKDPYFQEISQKMIIPNQALWSIYSVAVIVGVILYLLYVRRYFNFKNVAQARG